MNGTYLISGSIYFGLTILLGLYLSRGTTSSRESYYLADRKIGRIVGALSASASSESAWVMMGLAGSAYASGLSVFWLIPGCMAGYAFNWFVIAPRLNEACRKNGSITLAQCIGEITGSKVLKVAIAVIIIMLLLAYTSAQFLALGRAFAEFGPFNIVTGIIVGAVIIAIYLSYGGMRASIYTDILQAGLMFVALILLPLVAAITYFNGVQPAQDIPAGFLDFSGGSTGMALIGLILGWSGIGLAYPGQPHVLSRFMSMESSNMRMSGVISIAWSTFVFSGAILGGMAGRYVFSSLADPELVLINLMYSYLNPVLGGVVIAAVFSAIASTADSQLLAVTSTLQNDFDFFDKKKINPRYFIIVISCIGAYFASTQNVTIFNLVLNAWEILGIGVGTPVIGAIILNRSSRRIMIGMAAGLITLFFWKYTPQLSGVLYALVPASLVSFGVLCIRGRK